MSLCGGASCSKAEIGCFMRSLVLTVGFGANRPPGWRRIGDTKASGAVSFKFTPFVPAVATQLPARKVAELVKLTVAAPMRDLNGI